MPKPDPAESAAIPDRLRDALANYPTERVLVPPSIDETVLRLAQQRLRRRTGRFSVQQRIWWAAAALIATALVIWSLLGKTDRRRDVLKNAAIPAQAGDLD